MPVTLLGMINGILPCGLTYASLTYCLTFEIPWDGFVFMMVFGLGTWPVMVGFTWIIGRIRSKWNIGLSRITSIVLIGLGVLLIGRSFWSGNHLHHNDLQNSSAVEFNICQ